MIAVLVSTLASVAAALLVLWAQPYLNKLKRRTLLVAAAVVMLGAVALPLLPESVFPWLAALPWERLMIPVFVAALLLTRFMGEALASRDIQEFRYSIGRLGRELAFLGVVTAGLVPLLVATALPETKPRPSAALIGVLLMVAFLVLFLMIVVLDRLLRGRWGLSVAVISLMIGTTTFFMSVLQTVRVLRFLMEWER